MKVIILRGKSLVSLAIACSFLFACGSAWSLRRSCVQTLGEARRSLPIYAVETKEKAAALGINCAWDNVDIPILLETLGENQVKATFFILGQWAEKYPETVKTIAEAGHEIASHSYSHRDLTTLSASEITEELSHSMKVIGAISQTQPKLIRPPSGAYNNLVIDSINSLGYTPIQWDVDTLDWKKLTASEILERVSSRTVAGSILLLHSGAPHTAEALPQILHSLKQDGFELKPVGQLIYPKPYSLTAKGTQQRILRS